MERMQPSARSRSRLGQRVFCLHPHQSHYVVPAEAVTRPGRLVVTGTSSTCSVTTVTVGGGANQRLALYDGILIKENHIAAAGSVDLYNINVAAPQRITLWETSVARTALAYGVLAVISALLLAFTYSRLRLKKR